MTISPDKLNNLGAIILCAGRGTRLNCVDKPKAMLEVGGRPMVSYVLEVLKNLGFNSEQIILVVGFQKEKVYEYFGDTVNYAVQEEQLGTSHATYIGMKRLKENVSDALILNGDDSVFYTLSTILNFIENHLTKQASASLLTAPIDMGNFGYGRVTRRNGLVEIMEKEYLTQELAKLTETSTGTFIFNKDWFLREFPNMPPLEKLGEYGLPSAFTLIQNQGLPVAVMKLENKNEWFGINTPEELEEANRLKVIR